MGGIKGQFPQPFKDMGFLHNQERLPNDLFGECSMPPSSGSVPKRCAQAVHYSHLLIRQE